ncbi:MAG: hypothetical protein M0038_13415 [Pseudomonadota bacterium]|jgi:hypothetical protein|nr:hypothetical protein [Pseudomonadota bacterium]
MAAIRLASLSAVALVVPLFSGCAGLHQWAAEEQAQQDAQHYELQCYAERDYPQLLKNDSCTERDMFNGQQIQAEQAAQAARAAAAEAQEQANLRAEQAALNASAAATQRAIAQQNRSLQCTTTYSGNTANTSCNEP